MPQAKILRFLSTVKKSLKKKLSDHFSKIKIPKGPPFANSEGENFEISQILLENKFPFFSLFLDKNTFPICFSKKNDFG